MEISALVKIDHLAKHIVSFSGGHTRAMDQISRCRFGRGHATANVELIHSSSVHGVGQNRTAALHRCGYEERPNLPNARMNSLRMMVPSSRQGLHVSEARFECPAHGVPM